MSDRDNKISFSELDRRRREKKRNGGERRPRGEQAERRARATSALYRKRIDERLFGKGGDAGRSRREERLREAEGSPTFLRTFREYVKDYGMPTEMGLLLVLLDVEEERDVLRVMEAIDANVGDASLDERNLLRKRLQNLEMTTPSDALADAAVDLLSRL